MEGGGYHFAIRLWSAVGDRIGGEESFELKWPFHFRPRSPHSLLTSLLPFSSTTRILSSPKDDHTGPFNLGNPGEFTMLELAQLVKEVVNPKSEIIFCPNTSDDPGRRKPDITKVSFHSAYCYLEYFTLFI